VHEVLLDDPMTAADRRSKAARDEVLHLGRRVADVARRRRRPVHHHRAAPRSRRHPRTVPRQRQHWRLLEPAAERDDRGLELRDDAGELVWRDDRAPGELIAPQMLTREKLAGIRKSVRVVQYQQRPEEDGGGGTIARNAWGSTPRSARIRTHRGPTGARRQQSGPTVVTPDSFDAYVISCDPTFGGTKTENDFCSIQVWGRATFICPRSDIEATGYFLLARWHERAKQLVQQGQLKAFREPFPYARSDREHRRRCPA
jgi:hypothetical protein